MMENLQTNNPKAYWQLVEELSDNIKKKGPNIDIAKLFNHYKDLNSPGQNFNSDELQKKIDDLEQIKNFSKLDFSISESEINKAIKSLKNG